MFYFSETIVKILIRIHSQSETLRNTNKTHTMSLKMYYYQTCLQSSQCYSPK
jgi:hypothetical protein